MEEKLHSFFNVYIALNCIGTFLAWFFNLMGTYAAGISATTGIIALLANLWYLVRKDKREESSFKNSKE